MTTRRLLPVAVMISAVAAFGCEAGQFNAINDQFKTVKTSSTTLKSSTLPAAAMATSLAAVELMNAIAADTEQKSAGGAQLGNVIAPGAGNVIAPGGLNFEVMQAPETTSKLDDEAGTGSLKSVRGGKTILDVTFGYSREKTEDGYKFELVGLKGETNGFTVTADGKYAFGLTGQQVNGKQQAELDCTISGTLKTKSSSNVFKLEELSFKLTHPNNDTSKRELGKLKMADDNGSMEATVMIAGTTVTAEGNMKDAKGNLLYTLTMDENGVKTTEGGEK